MTLIGKDCGGLRLCSNRQHSNIFDLMLLNDSFICKLLEVSFNCDWAFGSLLLVCLSIGSLLVVSFSNCNQLWLWWKSLGSTRGLNWSWIINSIIALCSLSLSLSLSLTLSLSLSLCVCVCVWFYPLHSDSDMWNTLKKTNTIQPPCVFLTFKEL